MITLRGLRRFELSFRAADRWEFHRKMKDRDDYRGEYWWRMRQWAEKEVTFKTLQVQLYDLTEEDRDGRFAHIL